MSALDVIATTPQAAHAACEEAWRIVKVAHSDVLKMKQPEKMSRTLYNEAAETIADWQRKHADVARRLAEAEEAWLKTQEIAEKADV